MFSLANSVLLAMLCYFGYFSPGYNCLLVMLSPSYKYYFVYVYPRITALFGIYLDLAISIILVMFSSGYKFYFGYD